jgi:lysophospholipase L1-like esterase
MSDETPRPDRRSLLASMALLAGAGALPARAAQGSKMMHVVLLGDSIFDNKAYVAPGPDVIVQVREALPSGSSATLTAVDGAVTTDVRTQLKTIPTDATHLIVSAGGNDALQEKGLIEQSARSVAEALDKLAKVRDAFRARYAAMLDAVTARKLPVGVCTIYEARYEDAGMRKIAAAGLALFNDTILREAFKRGLPVVDLRLMFDNDADYANDIEPSVKGGAKIARAISTLVETHNFKRRRSEIYL